MKMLIKEFAEFTGVSVRTLHYYDEIGLLKPAIVDSFTGYRFYDEDSLLRMQEILFYRELDFSLKSICEILSFPNYDRKKALEEQKNLLILKKERLERLILTIDDAVKGENVVSTFDNKEYETARKKYEAEAKARWGETQAYKEYEDKKKNASSGEYKELLTGMEEILEAFASYMKNGMHPKDVEIQKLVKKLQDYITANFYTCTNQILAGLGQMYVMDERFKKNIDRHADGTAEFIRNAIEIYQTRDDSRFYEISGE